MNRLQLWLCRAVAALILISASSLAAPAEDLVKVKALLPLKTVDESFAPFAVAKYLGYFEQEGLDVTLLTVGGSNEAAIEVSAGNGDVGIASPAEALVGLQAGKNLDIQYYYDLYYRNIWSLSVLPDSPIRTAADIKGKKLGIIGMGSAGITLGRAMAKEAGLDPDKDISFIPVGVGAQAMTAIRQKLVDAVVFPDNMLSKFAVTGLPLRSLPVSQRLTDLPDVGILTRRETIRDNPRMLIGFARAVDKAYIFDMANPAAAVKITWILYPEAEPKNQSPEEALKGGIAVNQSRMALWSSPKTGKLDGSFIKEDWENRIDFLLEQGTLTERIPLEKVYTGALIEQINQFDRQPVLDQAKSFDLKTMK